MAKFMILYNSPEKASEFMARFSPEQMKAGMDAWIAWRDAVSGTVKMEFGMPLEAVARMTPQGITESDSKAGGYAFIECDSKDILLDALKSHPHLQRPAATIDVLELVAMGDMKS